MNGTRAVLLDGHSPPQVVLPDEELNGGKQAVVFLPPEDPSIVIKIYFKTTAQDVRRLSKMLEYARYDEWLTRDDRAHPELAWPITVARDTERGEIVGYAMLCVGEPDFHPLGTFFSHRERLTYFGDASWRFPLGIARNLSALVARLHRRGLVVSDMSDRNLVVSGDGYLTILDCDSIDFTDPVSGERFAGSLATPEYAAPELHYNANALKSPATDNFSLAVIVYRLLMLGIHPYQGVSRDPKRHHSLISDNIRDGVCHLISPDDVTIPSTALAPDILPPEVRALAETAFGPGHLNPSSRPDAAAWARALHHASDELATCTVGQHHVYSAHLTRCPWCARVAEGRPDPFTVPQRKPKAKSQPAPAIPQPLSQQPQPSNGFGRVALTLVVIAIVILLFVFLA